MWFETTKYQQDAFKFVKLETVHQLIDDCYEWAKERDMSLSYSQSFSGNGTRYIVDVHDYAGVVFIGYIETYDEPEEEE